MRSQLSRRSLRHGHASSLKGRHLTYDVCASLTLSAHRYFMHGTVDINSACKNVSAAASSATCNPNDIKLAKVDREGIMVANLGTRLLDVLDAPETIMEKLKSVKAAPLLVAPSRSFCVAGCRVSAALSPSRNKPESVLI